MVFRNFLPRSNKVQGIGALLLAPALTCIPITANAQSALPITKDAAVETKAIREQILAVGFENQKGGGNQPASGDDYTLSPSSNLKAPSSDSGIEASRAEYLKDPANSGGSANTLSDIEADILKRKDASVAKADAPANSLDKQNEQLLAEEAALLAKVKALNAAAPSADTSVESTVKNADKKAPEVLSKEAAIHDSKPQTEIARKEIAKETEKVSSALSKAALSSDSLQSDTDATQKPMAKLSQKALPSTSSSASLDGDSRKILALQGELSQTRNKVVKLTQDLEDAKNRLMISETEVERLSALLEEKGRAIHGYKSPSVVRANPSDGLRVRPEGEIQAKADTDMPIATVITEKAQLRTGPGMNNSPLMTVAQGTRLAIETRTGEWYRVIAPSGARAWVSAHVVDFGDVGKPDTAARSKGFSSDAEDAAFQAIAKTPPGN